MKTLLKIEYIKIFFQYFENVNFIFIILSIIYTS